MKTLCYKIILTVAIVAVCALPIKAQFIVADPTNLVQGILNTTNQIVQTSATVRNTLSNFNETVKIFEQGKAYYDALKSVNNLVRDARKVQLTVLLVGEISEIYVTNFQRIINDENFSESEVTAIGNGYAILLSESADLLTEINQIISINGLSMSDAERMAIIDRVYTKVKRHRDLVSYYTRKNISVSYLRAKKTGDVNRVLALYGNYDEKYW